MTDRPTIPTNGDRNRSARRAPRYAHGFESDNRGQAEIVGAILIIGLTVTGAMLIVGFGLIQLDDSQSSARVDRAGHALTQFDSQAAIVGLGDADVRVVPLSTDGSGNYYIDDAAGWLRVEHRNFTGTTPPTNETIMNTTIGAIVYRTGDRSVVYQGGGVWLHHRNGTVMVSPPEFQYRETTLTLPLVTVAGEGSMSGRVTAEIRKGPTRRVYPNHTAPRDGIYEVGPPYNNPTEDPYGNPVLKGTVVVTVGTDYYQGWADYFRARSDGNVTVDHASKTVSVQLGTAIAPGFVSPLPEEGNSITASGVPDAHEIDEFSVELTQADASANNVHFSFWAENGGEKFEIVVSVPPGTGNDCHPDNTIDKVDNLRVDVYYDNGTDPSYHGWTNDSIPPTSGPVRVECQNNKMTVFATFTSSLPMTFDDAATKGNPDFTHFSWGGKPHAGSATLEGHGSLSGHPDEPLSFARSDEDNLDYLVNHYMAVMGPTIDLTVYDGTSDRIDESQSSATIEYPATGPGFITYLHVSTNEIRVEFN